MGAFWVSSEVPERSPDRRPAPVPRFAWSCAGRCNCCALTARRSLEIAAITGYTHSYVSTLLTRMTDKPVMLERMSRGGRPQNSLRALSAKEERRAQQLICGKCPDQRSMPFALWTRSAIRELIRREFGIRLSIRGVGEYVARWVRIPAIVNTVSTRW